MKHKHFTFDLDYFPITNSNVFQNIKIQPKSKNININKNGLKRFSIKNELNFQQIPEIMFFEKSIKITKNKSLIQNISPSSNQTKKSQAFSHDELDWSNENKINKSSQKQRRVQSCPKPSQMNQNNSNNLYFKVQNQNQSKWNNLIEQQKQIRKSANFVDSKYLQRNSHKNSQLQSLQQCQSQFDESSQDSLIDPKFQCKTNNLRIENQNLKSQQNERESKKTKCTYSEKHNKSKKSEKSHNSKCPPQNNPEVLSNKDKIKQKSLESQKQKDQTKISTSLLDDENRKIKNKFISLNRKSYYLIGSKSNKHRSLNKDKKTKNKSLRQDANVILTNGDLTQNSTSIPSNCRNSSLTSTVNSKIKAESCKHPQQKMSKIHRIKQHSEVRAQYIQIVKRTEKVLDKYKGQCIQLKREKQEYQVKYEQAIKKLNRIRQELQIVMKPE